MRKATIVESMDIIQMKSVTYTTYVTYEIQTYLKLVFFFCFLPTIFVISQYQSIVHVKL